MALLPTRRHHGPEQRIRPWEARSWDPLTEFERLWSQMGQILEQTPDSGETTWRPLAEIEAGEDAYLVRVELPGVKRDDIDVEVTGNELVISGEVKRDESGKNGALQGRTGRFVYRTSLPAGTDTEKIRGELADGILTVRVPKSDQDRPRRVEISG